MEDEKLLGRMSRQSGRVAAAVLGQDSRQLTSAVSKPFHGRAKGIEQAQIQIRQRSVLLVHEVLPTRETPTAAATDDEGQIVRAVSISIAEASTKQDHGIVENGSFAFLHASQFVQQVSILLDMPLIDEVVHLKLFGVLLMMGDVMVAAAHTLQEREIAAANRVAEHERADSSGVGLQCQGHHVEHPPNILRVGRRILLG